MDVSRHEWNLYTREKNANGGEDRKKKENKHTLVGKGHSARGNGISVEAEKQKGKIQTRERGGI